MASGGHVSACLVVDNVYQLIGVIPRLMVSKQTICRQVSEAVVDESIHLIDTFYGILWPAVNIDKFPPWSVFQ